MAANVELRIKMRLRVHQVLMSKAMRERGLDADKASSWAKHVVDQMRFSDIEKEYERIQFDDGVAQHLNVVKS